MVTYDIAELYRIATDQRKVATALLQRLSYLEQMPEVEVSHTLPKFRGDKLQYQVMDEVAHFTEEEN